MRLLRQKARSSVVGYLRAFCWSIALAADATIRYGAMIPGTDLPYEVSAVSGRRYDSIVGQKLVAAGIVRRF
jgi:hypothetical protein